jgi:ABC-type multidrug transport system fused ATPase/permease subunit
LQREVEKNSKHYQWTVNERGLERPLFIDYNLPPGPGAPPNLSYLRYLKKVLHDILNILNRGEKQKLWQLAVADVIISVLDIVFLVGLLYVVNFYTQRVHSAPLKMIPLKILDEHPLLLILAFFGLFTIKNWFGFVVSKWQYHFVYGVASRISGDSLLQYLRGSYHEYIQIDSSVINRKISQQPVEFCHYVLNGIQQIFSQTVLVIITLIAVLIFNPLLFPLLILMLAPPVFLISFLMKQKLNVTRELGKKTSEKAIQHLQEALAGYVESNMYIKNDFFLSRYDRFQKKLNHYLSERLVIQSLPPRLIEVFAVFGLLILILVNFYSAHNSTIQLVTIGALMVAAYKIIPGIVKITNTIGQVKTYAYSASGLVKPVNAFSGENPDIPIRSVSFEQVDFNFGEKNILKGFSVEIVKGDMLGVTGISGKGKTTFVNLLLGFLTPDTGNILINGRVSDSNSRKGFWKRISYIKQQHFFLHGTIIENITLEEGGYDRERLDKILKATAIDKMIISFPQGLDTIITENGKNFSGGQRQRFVMARALYKDFDLLIVDEPFNELDELSETDMLKQLQSIAASGRMVVLITHNKDALAFCNKKLVMDE